MKTHKNIDLGEGFCNLMITLLIDSSVMKKKEEKNLLKRLSILIFTLNYA